MVNFETTENNCVTIASVDEGKRSNKCVKL